jgi:hypothetical protein
MRKIDPNVVMCEVVGVGGIQDDRSPYISYFALGSPYIFWAHILTMGSYGMCDSLGHTTRNGATSAYGIIVNATPIFSLQSFTLYSTLHFRRATYSADSDYWDQWVNETRLILQSSRKFLNKWLTRDLWSGVFQWNKIVWFQPYNAWLNLAVC